MNIDLDFAAAYLRHKYAKHSEFVGVVFSRHARLTYYGAISSLGAIVICILFSFSIYEGEPWHNC